MAREQRGCDMKERDERRGDEWKKKRELNKEAKGERGRLKS